MIDRLVHACREGQGQIDSHRVRTGLWNRAAGVDADDLPDQHAANVLLARLDRSEREILAVMLAQAFVGGVHETLVVLHEAEIPPFDDGYEGTPFHDFVGRLDDWPWPDEWSRPLE